jgi:ABC-type polysaccharide/polyol phosphate export permease
VQLLLVYPLGLLLASVNVVVRDIEYLTAILLNMMFFLTPIVYLESSIPPHLRTYFELNPFNPLIAAWRAAFFDGRFDWESVGQTLLFAAGAMLVAAGVHRRIAPKIGELL